MKKEKIIILDTETTGFSPTSDEILQLSIIDGNNEVLINEYFKPEYKAEWKEAMAVNGITPEFLEDKKCIKEYLNQIQIIFDNADCIVGYNTSFDLNFLKAIGIKINDKTEIIDVMRDFAEIYGEFNKKTGKYKWQKLIKCAEYYGFDWNTTGTHAHDSLGDCFATLHCFINLKEEMKNKTIKTWKVYGNHGHRQRLSFEKSFKYDFSRDGDIRVIEILNSDKTGTNDYSVIRITRNTRRECADELDDQISDGIFENYNVGKVIELKWESKKRKKKK